MSFIGCVQGFERLRCISKATDIATQRFERAVRNLFASSICCERVVRNIVAGNKCFGQGILNSFETLRLENARSSVYSRIYKYECQRESQRIYVNIYIYTEGRCIYIYVHIYIYTEGRCIYIIYFSRSLSLSLSLPLSLSLSLSFSFFLPRQPALAREAV
jgi:hypothetical protein